MNLEQHLLFPPFRLDLINERLWRESRPLSLRPKTFAVLRYLAELPRRLVTRQELLNTVWPGTYVSEGLLRKYIHELRTVLGDDPQVPQFIETVARRGYRFIAPIHLETRDWRLEASSPSLQVSSLQPPASTVVGRETELVQFHNLLGKALSGRRQVVFVTGEPGIGKTTIVEAFLAQAVVNTDLWAARGQCVEHYGAGEAYLPVLDALGSCAGRPMASGSSAS